MVEDAVPVVDAVQVLPLPPCHSSSCRDWSNLGSGLSPCCRICLMVSMSLPLLCSACISFLGRPCRLFSPIVPLPSGLVALSVLCCGLVPLVGGCILLVVGYLVACWTVLAFLTEVSSFSGFISFPVACVLFAPPSLGGVPLL